LPFSTSSFHYLLFIVNSFLFFTLSTSISFRIPSIHLLLGFLLVFSQMVSSWLVF
jgi:hypothetical protein